MPVHVKKSIHSCTHMCDDDDDDDCDDDINSVYLVKIRPAYLPIPRYFWIYKNVLC